MGFYILSKRWSYYHRDWGSIYSSDVIMPYKVLYIFRFGTLDLEPPKKKAANSRKKAEKGARLGAGSKPKEVQDLKDEEESTTKDVSHIWKHLAEGCRKKGRVNYFMYLVDPTSFGQTVENMFHFAFLIKDGRMGVTLGRDNLPYIYIRKSCDYHVSDLGTR